MKQGLVRLLYNFGKRFMGWTLHMTMCSSMLSCFYSHLLSTGRPISSFKSKSIQYNVKSIYLLLWIFYPCDTFVVFSVVHLAWVIWSGYFHRSGCLCDQLPDVCSLGLGICHIGSHVGTSVCSLCLWLGYSRGKGPKKTYIDKLL